MEHSESDSFLSPFELFGQTTELSRDLRMPVKLLKIITFASALSLPLIPAGCGVGDNGARPLTWTVTRRNLVSSVTAEGVVQALRSHALITPRIRTSQQLEISYLAPEGSYLKKGEIAVEFNGEQLQTQLEQALRELETARSDLTRLEAEHQSRIARLEAQINRSEASMESARLKLAELEFIAPREREVRQLQIEKSSIESGKSSKKLASNSEVHQSERTQQLLKIKQVESQCALYRSNLEQLVLKAPVDGYVQYGINNFTGEQVKPGDRLYSGWIVVTIPDISTLQVKLQLSETEVQRMETGQQAQIIIESLNALELNGEVAQVAQVAKPVNPNSKVKKIEVAVTIKGTAAGLVPGLSAKCTIIKERVDSAVVVPLETIFERDSARVVYSLSGDKFAEKEVQLGARGENFAVIQAGLEGGERLALRKPDRGLIMDKR